MDGPGERGSQQIGNTAHVINVHMVHQQRADVPDGKIDGRSSADARPLASWPWNSPRSMRMPCRPPLCRDPILSSLQYPVTPVVQRGV